MKRNACGRWCLYLTLAVCLLAIGILIGRLSAGRTVRVRTERSGLPEVAVQDGSGTDTPETAAEPTDAAQDDTEAEFPINLNTASAEELTALPRIGEKLAARIVAYREEYGRFVAIEQLMDVDGIGEGIFSGLRELVCVEEHDENSGG